MLAVQFVQFLLADEFVLDVQFVLVDEFCTSCARSLRSCVAARARPQVGLGPLALRVGGSVAPNSDLLLIWIGCLSECLVVFGNVWLFFWMYSCLTADYFELIQLIFFLA